MPVTGTDAYHALRHDAAALDLGSWGVLHLTGSDVREFLQGTATQELAPATADRAATTLFLTEKGRPVALAWVVIEPSGHEAWIVTDEGARSALRPHFERFRIMEDVEFEGPDRMPRVIGVAGPERANRLSALASLIGGSRAINAEPLSFLLAPSQHTLPFVPADVAEAGRLAVGLPRAGVDFDTDRIATELDLPDAISSSKGCYVGQEVVARISNRGQVRRRRMGFRFRWPAATPPAPKSELRTAAATAPAAAGFLTSAAPEPGTDGWLGMGYLSTDAATAGDPLVLTHSGTTVPISLQPWPL
jgi:folate-binding protein YgfZ